MKESKEQSLFKAVTKGDVDVVKSLLADGADVHARMHEATALYRSVDSLHYQITEIILQHAPYMINDSINYRHYKPLHLAVERGDITMVALLVQYNADPNVVDKDGGTPLHIAVDNEQTEIASLLIDIGSDVNALKHGLSSLHHSAIVGNLRLVQLLLENNADSNAVTGIGLTARDLYGERGPESIIEFDQTVLAAQHAIRDNTLIISKSLEYSFQLVGLPYLSNCFGIIVDYVGGYGKRLDGIAVDELADMVASQLASTSTERKLTKRKQCADGNWVTIKKRKEIEDKTLCNASNKEEEHYSNQSSSSESEHTSGDVGIRESTSFHSAEQFRQQQSMVFYQSLSNAANIGQYIHDVVVNANEPGKALLMELFVWIQDLSEPLQQRILGLFTALLEVIGQHDKFIDAQLSIQSIEERFEDDSQKYYMQYSYVDNIQEEYAKVNQADSLVSFRDDIETITMGGAIVNHQQKHTFHSDGLHFLGGMMS